MAILIIGLIFLAVSTLVFSNRANILDSALTNHFLLLSPAKSLLNSSCTESDKFLGNQKLRLSHRYPCFPQMKMPLFLY